ncbi:Putative nickel-responsive regulator [Slackia heliotrinireducens]|nr:Putative nickel-responsive regulator [Slackia heliotrinireducens]
MRFSVAMPEDLLMDFDKLVATRGLAKNRSEVVRDLVRDALAEQSCDRPGEEVMGTLTIVFNHHTNDVREKLDSIQHDYLEQIVTSVHVHMDHELCMEVIILRGENDVVRTISNRIVGTKGVLHGNLSITSTGNNFLGLGSAGDTSGTGSHPHSHGGKPHVHVKPRSI